MKCYVCKKDFKNDEFVIPVLKYVENERRGDFVTTMPSHYIHATHLKKIKE